MGREQGEDFHGEVEWSSFVWTKTKCILYRSPNFVFTFSDGYKEMRYLYLGCKNPEPIIYFLHSKYIYVYTHM